METWWWRLGTSSGHCVPLGHTRGSVVGGAGAGGAEGWAADVWAQVPSESPGREHARSPPLGTPRAGLGTPPCPQVLRCSLPQTPTRGPGQQEPEPQPSPSLSALTKPRPLESSRVSPGGQGSAPPLPCPLWGTTPQVRLSGGLVSPVRGRLLGSASGLDLGAASLTPGAGARQQLSPPAPARSPGRPGTRRDPLGGVVSPRRVAGGGRPRSRAAETPV